MILKLAKLTIKNFKGIKSFEIELDGENVIIKAENGIGKTTVYDAFLWLLFGKNSEGRKDFEVRPLDSNNQPIKGLVLAVEAEIECDSTVHTLRKEHHEKVVKKQLRGYEALCTIDEVPKKVSEFQDYITKIIPEDTFKLLTDLKHFNSKLHHSERRKVLLDIAGKIGTPKGFDELLAALNGRDMKEYEDVLKTRKKRYVKERDEINPRIDEIHRAFEDFAETDTKSTKKERDRIKAEIIELDTQRQKLFEAEKERQAKIDLINELTKKKGQREAELASDTTGIKSLMDEKAKIEAGIGKLNSNHNELTTAIMLKEAQIKGKQSKLELRLESLGSIRDEYNKTFEAKTDDTCYACGQKLPLDKLLEIEEKRKISLASITQRGNSIKVDVDELKKLIAEREPELTELKELLKKAETELQKAQQARDKRFAEIDKQIKANETIPPESDKAWQIFDKQIKKTEAEIGKPVSEQLQQIDNQRTIMLNGVAQLDKALAQADRMKQDKARIAELEEKEKQLAQQITGIEEQLAAIDEYKATESRMIEQAVNGKFKYVEFKLFNQLLNESLEPCCEAILKGTPYSDWSSGEEIFGGIDIINVLSVHYDISVPMFIDHSESLTLPIETDAQTIKLFAEKGTKELIVVKEGALAHV